MKVALLTSHLGFGHTRALEAIKEKLHRLRTPVQTEVIDFWSLMDPKAADAIKSGYLALANHFSDYYDKLYQLDEEALNDILETDQLPPELIQELNRLMNHWFPGVHSLKTALTRTHNLDQFLITAITLTHTQHHGSLARIIRLMLLTVIRGVLLHRFKRRLRAFKPDIAVSTQIYGAVLSSMAKRWPWPIKLPVMSVVTDYGIHKLWVRKGVDYYCLPDEAIQPPTALSHQQAAIVTGIPLMHEFDQLLPPLIAKQLLKLDAQLITVLVTGGMYSLGTGQALQELVKLPCNIQIIYAGADQETLLNNDGLGAQVLQAIQTGKIKALGWCQSMMPVYRAADIVIGKAGGLTITESLACGRPFIATFCLGGQERFNIDYLEQNNLGRYIQPQQLATLLPYLNNRKKLIDWQMRCSTMANRHGTHMVVREILQINQMQEFDERIPLTVP